jgi:hypothetical protein
MDAESTPTGESSCQLLLHRPRSLATGLARRIHIFLDDNQVADLENGGTASVSASAGPHMLRARCRPMGGTEFPFILAERETLRAWVYVDALEDVRIELDPDNA